MKKKRVMIVLAFIASILLLYVEALPAKQCYSSLFSTSEGIEIELDIVMNTLLPVDVGKMTNRVVAEHQKVNGMKNNSTYKIHFYRTDFHYKRNCEYDMVIFEGLCEK